MSAKRNTFLSATSCFVLVFFGKLLKMFRVCTLSGGPRAYKPGRSFKKTVNSQFPLIYSFVHHSEKPWSLQHLPKSCSRASFPNSHWHFVVSTRIHSAANWVVSNTFSYSSWALLRIRNHSKGYAVTNPSTHQTIKISKLSKTNGKKT